MFQLIAYDELESGKKYKIEEKTYGFLSIAFRHNTVWYLKFYKKEKITYFSQYCDFYNFVSENPQWKMERRAVNMILRCLIGDHHFEW